MKDSAGKVAARPWDELLQSYVMSDARIVATIAENGGAIVEHVKRLECREGRMLHGYSGGDEKLERCILEYVFGFGVAGCEDPDASQAIEARIVVEGTHTNGFRMEIRGSGWIGYDDRGNVEGHFYAPPVIITEDSFGPDGAAEEAPLDLSERIAKPLVMPPQFRNAMVRHPR